jgi:hypothetical protein
MGIMYQEVVDKLIDFTERNARKIASEWCSSVKKNPRTHSYHSIPDENLISLATSFYKILRVGLSSENTFEAMADFANKYADDAIAAGIPLHEAVYALFMMRRQVWLHAEFQMLFTEAVDMYQAAESINRVVLLSDYATFTIINRYSKK